VHDSIATDEKACEIKRSWNAAICKGDVGRLSVGGPGGGFGGPRGGGPGAGGPGAAPRAGGPAPGAATAAMGAAAPAPGAGPGAAAARGGAGPGAPGGRAGGPGAAPAQPPVVLSRNGKDYNLTSTNVRAGTEIKVTTERPSVNLSLSELDAGSWVLFELPGFNTAASGTAVESLDALRKANATSYYKANDALWVKVVSNGGTGRAATSLQVSR